MVAVQTVAPRSSRSMNQDKASHTKNTTMKINKISDMLVSEVDLAYFKKRVEKSKLSVIAFQMELTLKTKVITETYS